MPIPLTGGLLSGQIRDEGGKPVPGAEISVFDRGNRRVAHSDSDPFGYFAAAVVPGDYRVRAEFGGFQSVASSVSVDWGKHAELGEITMVADPSLEPPAPGVYEIDSDHSSVRFVARHIALSKVYGRFNDFRGTIHVEEPFEDSIVEVVIDAASVDTNVEARDAHLRSADFLDVERFPQLRFTSTRFTRRAGNSWVVDGELTLHGLTSDVQLDTTFLGIQDWNGTRAGVFATTELHREHFTLNWQQVLSRGVPVVGSTIEIELDIQAVYKG
ncbi:YceI family protein [Pseudonocardia sp. N23]|uniref:YceI family protein n=1 Tax=Pseudonocardia sp. N23 TaxID=1987376 RepID=UPI000BFD1842|nr:YceI family protein [Pseudonocardia sp. N23]GAY09385.1 YceI family protein [Pseudonocardia sp. N23]